MNKVYIDNVAQTIFGKDSRPLEEIFRILAEEILNKAKNKPDVVIVGNYNYQGYTGQASLDALVSSELAKHQIITPTAPVYHINRGSASGAAAIQAGLEYAAQGKTVLVLAGEEMFKDKPDRDLITQETSKVVIGEEQDIVTMPRIAGIATSEYMFRHKISEDSLRKTFFEILNKNRRHGASNPYAYFKDEVPEADYFDEAKNPFVARPLSRNDCAGTYNGAAGVLLVPYKTDLVLSGLKSASADNIKISGRTTLTSLSATVNAGAALFESIDLNPAEIDIVELHDAFQSVPLLAAEDLGLAKRGEGAKLVLNEENLVGKEVLHNRSGGFLSKTHPIGASGTAQLVELVLQMRHQDQYDTLAGDLNYGLWFSMHGFGFYNCAGVVEKTKPTVAREGYDPQSLPEPFSQTRWFKGFRRSMLVGLVPIDNNDEYSGIGIIQNKADELRLGYLSKPETPKVGTIVADVEGDETTYFKKDDTLGAKVRTKFLRMLRF